MPSRRRLIVGGSVIIVAPVIWFLCVDWSWFLGSCPHCGYIQHVLQYRVLGIPFRGRMLEEETLIQRMAADLGVPCRHPELVLFHKHRWWGLCYCAAPCVNGLWSIDGGSWESWYDEAAVRRLRSLAKRDPNFGPEFHQRVIRDNDWDYLRTITKQIASPDKLRPKLDEAADHSAK